MELQEFKEIWGEYDKKLEKNLQVNLQLLRQMLFSKAGFRIKWLFVLKITEMVFSMFIFNYLIGFIIANFTAFRFSIPALILEAAIIYNFILNIRMMAVMNHLQFRDKNEPIAPLQKKVQALKVLIADSLKYALFLIPGYPVLMILIARIFLKVDLYSPYFRSFLIANLFLGFVLLSFFVRIYRQLSQKEITKPWVKNLLSGSGWHLANDAGEFLNEIEKFEREG